MPALNPAGPTINGGSLWPRLAGLPLVIEACEYDRLHAVLADDFERIRTHVRLVGSGADGLGEDVSVFREDGTALHETRPSLPLEGEWTLADFCDHLATLELWPELPGSVGSPEVEERRRALQLRAAIQGGVWERRAHRPRSARCALVPGTARNTSSPSWFRKPPISVSPSPSR